MHVHVSINMYHVAAVYALRRRHALQGVEDGAGVWIGDALVVDLIAQVLDEGKPIGTRWLGSKSGVKSNVRILHSKHTNHIVFI